MTFSVIIPTCNRNDLLSKCIDLLSSSNQLIENFDYEVIVTDDSKEGIAKSLLEKQFKWAKWVKGPGIGPAANRNNGAKEAKGDWLIFIDDDCLPEKDIIYNYHNLINSDAEIDVLEGLIYSDAQIKPLFTAPVNLWGGYLWSCNFGIKKKIFWKIDGFDESYKYPNLEDNDLHKRLKQGGYKIIFAKNARVYHPPRPVSSPKKFAQYHESWLYYHRKFGETKTVADLLIAISKNKIRAIIKGPKSLVSIKVFFLLFAELFYTLNNSRKWNINKK